MSKPSLNNKLLRLLFSCGSACGLTIVGLPIRPQCLFDKYFALEKLDSVENLNKTTSSNNNQTSLQSHSQPLELFPVQASHFPDLRTIFRGHFMKTYRKTERIPSTEFVVILTSVLLLVSLLHFRLENQSDKIQI